MKEIVTHLNFDGNCRQAMEFYKKCFGAELHLLPFSEMPGDLPKQVKEAKDRIAHASLTNGSRLLMAADTMPGMPLQQGNNFTVCIQCDSLQEIDSLYSALGENGKVTMPLQKTFWTERFGMLTDQFGINWMFNFEQPKQG